MFKEALQGMIDRLDEDVIGSVIMDTEGIALEKVGLVTDDPTLDSETLGMEYTVILKSVKKTASMVDAGTVNEVLVRNEKFTTLLRIVNEDYFVALFLKPGGNVGKGRFLLRAAAANLIKEL